MPLRTELVAATNLAVGMDIQVLTLVLVVSVGASVSTSIWFTDTEHEVPVKSSLSLLFCCRRVDEGAFML